jgi:hypothetical protein
MKNSDNSGRFGKYFWLLLAVLLIAFVIRFAGSDRPFCGNDKAMFQQFSIDSLPIKGINSFFMFNDYGMKNPLRVFALLYSIIYPIFWMFILAIYWLLGIPITDLAWRIPIILAGVFSIAAIYYFLQLFLNKKQSLIVSAFFAVLPVHVAWSRSISNIMLFSLPIQLGAMYYFMKYFETDNRKYLFWSSGFTALFIITDNFFPQFLVVMGFIFLVYNPKLLSSKENFKKSILRVFNFHFLLLPILAVSLQILIFIAGHFISTSDVGTNFGMLGHILAKPKYLGVHLISLSQAFLGVVGPVLSGFILIIALLGLKSLFRLRKESILLFAALIYSLPFAFFMDPSGVNVKIYIFTSIIFFFMYGFTMLFRTRFKNYLRNMILAILFLAAILSLFPKVYAIPEPDLNFISAGANLYDCGLPAIGYWVRTNTNVDATIMTRYDLARVGPITGKYYLHRKVYSVFEPRFWDDFFWKHIDEIDLLILSPNDTEYVKAADEKGFFLNYVLNYKGLRTYLVFSRQQQEFKQVDISKFGELYKETFNKITDYVNSPDYVAESPSWV